MTDCLIAFGSNMGDRAATLDAALVALSAAPGVELLRQSAWHLTLPVGCRESQPEFLNGAALVETSLDSLEILALLQQFEKDFGRERHERWGNRTLDLDLLLLGDAIIDTPDLIVPHPRMSFRRFVLEPAVEIAAPMVHPTIGWTLEHLLDHLDVGADCVALLSPNESARHELVRKLSAQLGMTNCYPAAVNPRLWPADSTTWLAIPNARMTSEHPKLTIVVDDAGTVETGRGPTLRVSTASGAEVEREVFAAIDAIWPHLGPLGG